nr:phosphotransferase family protein [Shouchella shacheensis]
MFLGEGWHVLPAGGATGEAYLARHGDYQLFIKRNSSPFLAVLSAEGIVPKLLWTKRLGNGDVITAQHWVQGRELKAIEMNAESTALMLSKIHNSSELLDMFMRIGNEPLVPSMMLGNMHLQLQLYEIKDELIEKGMDYLIKQVEQLGTYPYVVCHCDINHNNWLVDERDDLYLIDWDGATVADPALDLGLLLYTYVPEKEWEDWLHQYGVELNGSLRKRMHWYVVAQTISEILWHASRGHEEQVDDFRTYLSTLIS